jgi:hypothetical protein
LIEKTSHQESSIVENYLHKNILGNVSNPFHVILSRCKVAGNRKKLELGELRLDLFHGSLEKIIIQRHYDDIQTLFDKFKAQRFANAAASTGDQGPSGIVSLLEVRNGAACHVELRDRAGDQPKNSGKRKDGHEDHLDVEASGQCKLRLLP